MGKKMYHKHVFVTLGGKRQLCWRCGYDPLAEKQAVRKKYRTKGIYYPQ